MSGYRPGGRPPAGRPPHPRVVELAHATWTEVASLPPERTVVCLAVGPMEEHGPHLPFGTDVVNAETMQERLVSALVEHGYHALVCPTLPYGTAPLAREFPGSVSVRREHLAAFVGDVLASFARNGLPWIVVTSCHIDPPFIRALDEACQAVNEQEGARALHGYEALILRDLLEGDPAELWGEEARDDVHAGLIETSYLLAVRPELVRLEEARRLPPVPVSFRGLQRLRSFRQLGEGLGYTGRPGAASPEAGRIWWERYTAAYVDAVLRHLQGEDVSGLLHWTPGPRAGERGA
ncbi:MAG: creatininase family protein [Bacillota bacterium]|nr:creatininase family protein [Bacillota bacterium]